MKFLNRLWPWKELNRLNEEIVFLKRALEHEQTSHNITRASLQDHKLELIDHKSRNEQSQKDIRKMATILAIRGGITLILFFLSLSAVGQPLQRNPVTTNLLGNAASVSYFLGWDGSKPAWGVPPDGLGTNSWLTNASFIFPIPHLAASNDLGWWNSGGDISANATNDDKLFGLNATNEVARMGTSITNGAILNLSNLVSTISQNATNQGTVVSNGVVAHTVTVAGTANQITSSVGTAQTIAANPATTLSLPDPLIAPGKVSANIITNRDFTAIGIVTNDANGKLYTTTTLPNALLANSSLTIAGTSSQISVAGGNPVSLGGTATLSIPTAPQLTNLFNSGDQYRTNGSTSTTVYDLMASNNLGSFSTAGGVSTSTVSMGSPMLITSNVTFRPMTVANLPTPSAGTFPVIYASDAVTASGTGGLVFWDGTNWRNVYENCVSTADIKTFILNCVMSGTVVNGTLSTIQQCFNPSALNAISINLPPIPTTYNLTGSGSQIGVAAITTNWGPNIDLQTGTTSSGDVRLWGALLRSQTANDYYACGGFVDVDVLCSSAEIYYTWTGIGTSANSATAPTSGAFFIYDMYTNSSAAINGASITYTNNWICVMVNSGTYAFANSGLPVQTGASNNTNRLGVILTTAGATFYTNGVLSQTLSTAGAIPAGVTLVSPYFAIKKTGGTVGTTSRHMYIGAPFVHTRYATSRPF